jgi:hypothetical protein
MNQLHTIGLDKSWLAGELFPSGEQNQTINNKNFIKIVQAFGSRQKVPLEYIK